ncbi:MAG: flagellar filament capping protein FliD [Cyanobacteria bacterium HKST-UBA03]|nr:flagellar filament capping protein FliD [Cyanobacteria bacterium HKST-UBA03]
MGFSSGSVSLNVGTTFDWHSLIQQLAFVEEQQTVTPLRNQQATLRDKSSSLNTFLNLVSTVQDKADLFRSASLSNPFGSLAATFANADQADELGVSVAQSANTFKGAIDFKLIAKGTATTAQSTARVGNDLTATSSLDNINNQAVTAGTFTIFADGTAYDIAVNSGETVGDVLSRIDATVGTTTSSVLGNGKVRIDSTATTLDIGATSDTSNFATVVGLTNASYSSNRIQSTFFNSEISLSADATTAAAGLATTLTAGTFSINDVEFTISAGDSISDILNDINSNAAAGVTVSYDVSTNKFNATSKDEGSNFIKFTAGTSNFLSAANLDNTTTSQTLGADARFKINGGATLTAASNNIDLSVYGFSGVTVDVTNAIDGDTYNFTVGQDSASLKEKVKDFVKAYNDLAKFYDKETAVTETSRGKLAGNFLVRNLFQDVRTALQEGTANLTLGQAGISTGAIGSSVSAITNELTFDEAAFDAALANDPTEVESLFDTAFTNIFNKLDPATEAVTGLIATSITSVQDQISQLDDRIQRALDRIETQRQISEKRFIAMEDVIRRFQSQTVNLPSFQ